MFMSVSVNGNTGGKAEHGVQKIASVEIQAVSFLQVCLNEYVTLGASSRTGTCCWRGN